jgi:hypothetical protein
VEVLRDLTLSVLVLSAIGLLLALKPSAALVLGALAAILVLAALDDARP